MLPCSWYSPYLDAELRNLSLMEILLGANIMIIQLRFGLVHRPFLVGLPLEMLLLLDDIATANTFH